MRVARESLLQGLDLLGTIELTGRFRAQRRCSEHSGMGGLPVLRSMVSVMVVSELLGHSSVSFRWTCTHTSCPSRRAPLPSKPPSEVR
jgi:hypothetical protein